MRRTTRRLATVSMYGAAAAAVLILAFACSLQSPDATAPVRGRKLANDVRKLPAMISAAPAPAIAQPNQAFFEFQVEHQAEPLPNNRAPRYPDALRKAGVEGEVLVMFVLNRDGTPDVSSLKVLRSTHSLFTEAVKAGLPAMRFKPALVGGLPVKQLVQMPFQFNLSKDAKPLR